MTDNATLFVPGKKGKLPPLPERPRLMFADFATAIPDHPASEPVPQLAWPMDKNDVWGDCVLAAKDHAFEAIKKQLGFGYTNMTDAELLADYQTQNPGFDGTGEGNGMVIQLYLELLRKRGDILAFAQVDHTNADEMKAAIYLFLSLITGCVLTKANDEQFSKGQPWDYVAGSEQIGGHATNWVAYGSLYVPVTWGRTWWMTDAFVANQIDEVWVVLLKEHFSNPTFRAGIDADKLAAAFTALTGEPFSPPDPVPTPPPGPVLTPDQKLAALAHPYVLQRHYGANHIMQLGLKKWLEETGL